MTATNYTTTDQFKTYASIPTSDTSDDTIIGAVVQSVYSAINGYCSRVFATATGSRIFEACCNSFTIDVDDISTATGVTISHDDGNTGVYGTTWTASDYELRPLNGLLNGQPWAYTEIHAVGNQSFPITYSGSDRAHIQISATWGWPAVPADVTQAAYILAMDVYKSKDAPFGVAGTTEFGNIRVGSNVAGLARMLLAPYRKHGVMI